MTTEFTQGCKHLGVVTQHNTLWDKLTVCNHLRLFARLRGVSSKRLERLVQETISQMELGPYQHRLAERLSGGMKRKLCVAVAIIGNPDVVMLDEPSAGLDPVSRRNLWSTLIKTMSTRAVLLTTHSMEEADALCTRVGIMVEGQLKALGSPQHLKEKIGREYELSLTLDPAKGPPDDPQRIAELTSFMHQVFSDSFLLSYDGGVLTYGVPLASIRVGTAFAALEGNRHRLGLSDYSISQPTLEQVFARTVMAHRSNGERTAPGSSPEEGMIEAGIDSSEPVGAGRSPTIRHQRDEIDMFGTGMRKTWLGCNRRVHRSACILMTLFMIAAYGAIVPSDFGYVFFPFFAAFLVCLVGCVGCCCVIPDDPDDLAR
jgi:ABC-type multidrug transport system ATPase subunit